jgi:hypothetical protein
MKLIPHSLTAWHIHESIRSLLRFGKRVSPLALTVLYHSRLNPDASPKAISGRTSYHQVRLAFHLYPHLIRDFFNNHRFGPPLNFT